MAAFADIERARSKSISEMNLDERWSMKRAFDASYPEGISTMPPGAEVLYRELEKAMTETGPVRIPGQRVESKRPESMAYFNRETQSWITAKSHDEPPTNSVATRRPWVR